MPTDDVDIGLDLLNSGGFLIDKLFSEVLRERQVVQVGFGVIESAVPGLNLLSVDLKFRGGMFEKSRFF